MPILGIFAKRPAPGAVKTRLAAVIGAEAAARFYEVSLRTLLARVRSLSMRRVIGVGGSTDVERAWFQQFEGYELWSQPAGDLGQKLAAWFEFACATDDRVLVIGSDSPTLPIEFITRAVIALDACDCVIGPALDGGYYLLGLRCPAPQLLNGIEWSTPRVLEQTLARAAEQGLRVTLLPTWNDVDEVADLAALRDQLGGLGAAAIWEPLQRELDQIKPLVSNSIVKKGD